MSAPAATVQVDLAPRPGFCIKTTALASAVCAAPASARADKTQTLLADALQVPQGIKVFVNIAWDANVPPPPEGSEEAVQKAMSGEGEGDADGQAWFVPVVVSDPRSDVDKAGKPSIVIDCIYNASLKSRSTRDVAFKTFLIELALQRVEAQHGLSLSRQIGTPNIAAKGKLPPRAALVPLALFPAAHELRVNAEKNRPRLIEEVGAPAQDSGAKAPETGKPKGILKNGAAKSVELTKGERPKLEWTKGDTRIKITLRVPQLTRDDIASAALDVETRRIILDIPGKYHLDVDLSMSDAQIMATFGGSSSEGSALMLKRQREFDVDNATAEWRVQEGIVLIFV